MLGQLAHALKSVCSRVTLPFYIGTWDEEGPCSPESLEYWKTR